MAIYHLRAKIIKKGDGRTGVGAAAYRSGEELKNEVDGLTHDYTRKRGIEYTEIMLCNNAPQEYQDRETFWNAVEKSERQNVNRTYQKENKDGEIKEETRGARIAREIEIALPLELSRQEQIKLVQDYVKDNFVDKGMCADIAIHKGHTHKADKQYKNDDEIKKDNPHAHILLTMRPIDENGKWGSKSEHVYICKNRQGETRELTSKELQAANAAGQEWEKQFKYKGSKGKAVTLTPSEAATEQYEGYKKITKNPISALSRPNQITEEWNRTETLEHWREQWAVYQNAALEKKNLPVRVDHRSYEAQGINKIPTIHMGVSATAMERRGIESDNGNINREIKKINGQLTTNRIMQSQIQKEINNIREDIGWNKQHEAIAKIEAQIPKAAGNEKLLLSIQAGLLKYSDKAKLLESPKTSEGRTVEYNGRQIPYFDYHKDKLIADVSFLQNKVKGYLETLEQKRQEQTRTETTPKPAEPSRPQPQEKPKPTEQQAAERQAVSFNAASMAHQLAMLQNEYIREAARSQERTSYQPNPIHQQQAGQIESYAKTFNEQGATISQLRAERDGLGMFKGKEKKDLQGKIDNFERLRRENADKLKALGVSDPSRADETVKEKRQLAAQEQSKAQAAKLNEGAGSRAAEAKAALFEIAKTVPADQQQAVRSQMGQYADHSQKGMAHIKANIEIQKLLDEAFKGRAESREHEKIQTIERDRD